MEILLGPVQLEVALKEYLFRRGIPIDADLDFRVIGGRSGNKSSATVTLNPPLINELDPTPQIYKSKEDLPEPFELPTVMEEAQQEQAAEVKAELAAEEVDMREEDQTKYTMPAPTEAEEIVVAEVATAKAPLFGHP